jgi:hypothetical protein
MNLVPDTTANYSDDIPFDYDTVIPEDWIEFAEWIIFNPKHRLPFSEFRKVKKWETNVSFLNYQFQAFKGRLVDFHDFRIHTPEDHAMFILLFVAAIEAGDTFV